MGDVVTCKTVLSRSVDPQRFDYLYFVLPDKSWISIACQPKGDARLGGEARVFWEYEEREGRLHLTPSLLCTDTGFHTDYQWNVAFEVKPEEVSGFDHFFAINPEIQP